MSLGNEARVHGLKHNAGQRVFFVLPHCLVGSFFWWGTSSHNYSVESPLKHSGC